MALNLEEMVRAIISARALAASINMNEDVKAKEFKAQALRVMFDLNQVEEQLSMMRDMFAPSPPPPEDDD